MSYVHDDDNVSTGSSDTTIADSNGSADNNTDDIQYSSQSTRNTDSEDEPLQLSTNDLTRTQRIDSIIQDNAKFLRQHPTPPRFLRSQHIRKPIRNRTQPVRYSDLDYNHTGEKRKR